MAVVMVNESGSSPFKASNLRPFCAIVPKFGDPSRGQLLPGPLPIPFKINPLASFSPTGIVPLRGPPEAFPYLLNFIHRCLSSSI